ncbi:MAG TPA: EF-hand domain-containing protein [Syntrophorhabdales bacterium]|nr:EF-hand domain-containing protein [Syntrophorhabdales bacterium]
MAKYQTLVVAIVLGATLIAPAARGKTGTSAQRSQSARGPVDFVGEVLKVDTYSQSMTLRSGGNMVSFDISNAVLQGYGNIAGIKKGDRIGAGYTKDGIHITKLSRMAEKTVPEKNLPEKGVPALPRAQKPKKPSLFARRIKTDGKSFADVDNNKDGKISAIELSVVIPGLTMEQFRQYDKNHDGYLDRAEFGQIKLP